MSKKHRYTEHLVIIRQGKQTRSALAITKLMNEQDMSWQQAYDTVLAKLIEDKAKMKEHARAKRKNKSRRSEVHVRAGWREAY